MINKSVDEAIFDTILAKAFTDAAIEDMHDEELNKDNTPVTLSPCHLKIERRAYERYEAQKKNSSIKRYTALRRIAACILIVGTIGFISVFAIPTVRAAVVGAVVEFFDKYMSFDFGGEKPIANSSVKIGDYTASYIPAGFELVDSKETRITSKYAFVNTQSQKSFLINCSILDDNGLQYDRENTKYIETSINGYPAYIIESEDKNSIVIIFANESNIFTISGNISQEELLLVASRIQ